MRPRLASRVADCGSSIAFTEQSMAHGMAAAAHPGRMIVQPGAMPRLVVVGDSAGPAGLVIGAGPSGLFSAGDHKLTALPRPGPAKPGQGW